MGELRKLWTDAKEKLTPQQRDKLPKDKFGEKCDAFEAACAKACQKLDEANSALWAAYVDGEKEKAGSVRDLLEANTKIIAANKDINAVIGKVVVELDRKKAGLLKKVMTEYAKIKTTAKLLDKYTGN